MDKEDKLMIIDDLTRDTIYPDGMIYDSAFGDQVPRITPENFGAMHRALCGLKAVLIAMLEEDNE